MMRSPRGRAILVASLAWLAVSGCAVMHNGAYQRVEFDSVPSGATVHVAGDTLQTPGALVLPRGRVYEATFKKKGYVTAHAAVTRRWSPALTSDLATLGAGFIVDFTVGWALGAIWEPDPPVVRVTLAPAAGAAAAAEADVIVAGRGPPRAAR